ncbi:Peptidase M20 [Carpediemonas membranifera]|uniref:Peptidase M20 n=1 Tax=Carpediemonas membranifera TaxID=201153 RepID=A0A8J6B8X6_9EUKA|nr:Peptidase M20 [Carpediemonas membranifera]|eukprot:KAG9392442.1 Peptidase M20 [Carpediemonas membranifera]
MFEALFKHVQETFIRYAKVATGSDHDSQTTPSTARQFDLARMLADELLALDVQGVNVSEQCVVTGHLLPRGPGKSTDVVLLNSHMDTSPDAPNEHVEPIVHEYKGGDIVLPRNGTVIPAEDLERYVGQHVITSSGDTLLGGDDKAGITQIMSLLWMLKQRPEVSHPALFVMFTPDEEVGRGTESVKVEDLVVPGHGRVTCGYTIDACHVGEVEDNTFTAYKTVVKFTGHQVHPGFAYHKMANTITAMAHFIDHLPVDNAPETTKDSQPYVFAQRVVADVEKSEVHLILRSFTDDDMTMMQQAVLDAAAAVRAHAVHGNVAIAPFEFIPQYRNMQDVIRRHPRVWNNLCVAVEKATGTPAVSFPMRGGTDGAMLAAQGLAVPNVWSGGVNFHSVREYVPVESMVKGVEMLLELCPLFMAQ